MVLEYARPERIGLNGHSEFDESRLSDRIAEDPTILGLGELVVLDRVLDSPTLDASEG